MKVFPYTIRNKIDTPAVEIPFFIFITIIAAKRGFYTC